MLAVSHFDECSQHSPAYVSLIASLNLSIINVLVILDSDKLLFSLLGPTLEDLTPSACLEISNLSGALKIGDDAFAMRL